MLKLKNLIMSAMLSTRREMSFFVSGFLLGLVAWGFYTGVRPVWPIFSVPLATKNAPAGSQPFTPQFKSDYDKFELRALNIQAIKAARDNSWATQSLNAQQDELVGAGQRLSVQLPSGFTVDGPSRTFVPVPKTPAAPAPPAATPLAK